LGLLSAAIGFAALAGSTGDRVVAQTGAYRLDPAWPNYPRDMEFEMGSGVAVDAKGVVYLYTRDRDHWAGHPLAKELKYRGRGSVSMFDRSGKYLGRFAGNEPLIGAHHIFIDREGFVWLVDRDGHQVKKMRADGTKVFELGRLGEWGNTPDRFNGPTGVAFLPNGDFVVSDGYWNSRILYFTKDGKFIRSVGSWGSGPSQFGTVHSIATDSRGRILVANLCGGALHPYVTAPRQIAAERTTPIPNCTSRIDIFDSAGKYLGVWPVIKSPLSVATYGNRIYASEASGKPGSQHLVIVEAATDKVVETLQNVAIYVHQMALDEKTGDIYVASVYPEHAGAKRGAEGPSHRRWTKDAK
jgi:hypothetical protein